MGEIEFRAIDLFDTKKNIMSMREILNCQEERRIIDREYSIFKDGQFLFEHYTGQTDKNGKKIFKRA
ncbi:MAG: hypothetical protein GY804_00675 [Alphaproteobacteria bacterium]|nr:hypothetical protein [Alphaproteobacteria bacterium]